MGIVDIVMMVTNKAVIRTTNIYTVEVRVAEKYINELEDKIYENFPAYYQANVFPLGAEEVYTTGICII